MLAIFIVQRRAYNSVISTSFSVFSDSFNNDKNSLASLALFLIRNLDLSE